MPIFDAARFRALAFEHGVTANDAAEHLTLLGRLTTRAVNGTLRVLTETRIEQSFNEQLFARIFGYATLFSHGGGDYDLLPKNFTATSKRYDDFSLGFFGPPPRSGSVSASVELKSPGTDLDARPTLNRLSPVEQAHSGAPPAVRWIVVSNFEEIRLYSVRNQTDYEKVSLAEVVDPYDLDRLTTLFSRRTLLGEDGAHSALDRLLAGGPPFMLPHRQGFIRVVHEVRPVRPPQHPLPLATMEDAVHYAMGPMPTLVWPRRSADWHCRLRDDRLVVETVENTIPTMMLELSRSGVMRLTEYHNASVAPLITVGGEDIACRVASFRVLCARLVGKLALGNAEVKWSLLDVSNASVTAPVSWVGGGLTAAGSFPGDVPSTHTPPLPLNVAAPRSEIAALVVRELFFPCEIRVLLPGGGPIKRLAPTPQIIEELLTTNIHVPRGATQDAAGQLQI